MIWSSEESWKWFWEDERGGEERERVGKKKERGGEGRRGEGKGEGRRKKGGGSGGEEWRDESTRDMQE